jgi:hypothetical protein
MMRALLVCWQPDIRVVGGGEENRHLVQSGSVRRKYEIALYCIFKQNVCQPAGEQQV